MQPRSLYIRYPLHHEATRGDSRGLLDGARILLSACSHGIGGPALAKSHERVPTCAAPPNWIVTAYISGRGSDKSTKDGAVQHGDPPSLGCMTDLCMRPQVAQRPPTADLETRQKSQPGLHLPTSPAPAWAAAEPDIEWPGLAGHIDGCRDIANAILADQSSADHGEARAPADVATTARSSRAHEHATALRTSHRHSQAMSHTSATVEPSQLSPAVPLDGWQASGRHSPAISRFFSGLLDEHTAPSCVAFRHLILHSAAGLNPWRSSIQILADRD